MKILLDTVAFLKWTSGEGLPKRTTFILQRSERFVSIITPWEVAIKASRLPTAKLPDAGRVASAIEALGATLLPVTLTHVQLLATLSAHHADPFNRMLISQAIAERMTVISNDERFPAYGSAGLVVLWS